MKTLFSTVLITVLAIGFLMAASPGKAEAWHRSSVSFSVIVPPFGVSIGTPFPYDYYYYPAPVYVAPYPVYGRSYYRPFSRHHDFGHRPVWRGEWDRHRHWGY